MEKKISEWLSCHLDKGTGSVRLTSYEWKGACCGRLGGLVIGMLDTKPVYVLVHVENNDSFSRHIQYLQHVCIYLDEQLFVENDDQEEDLERAVWED